MLVLGAVKTVAAAVAVGGRVVAKIITGFYVGEEEENMIRVTLSEIKYDPSYFV